MQSCRRPCFHVLMGLQGSTVPPMCENTQAVRRQQTEPLLISPLIAGGGRDPLAAVAAPHSTGKPQLCFIKSRICTSKYLALPNPCKKPLGLVCILGGVCELALATEASYIILATKCPTDVCPSFSISPAYYKSRCVRKHSLYLAPFPKCVSAWLWTVHTTVIRTAAPKLGVGALSSTDCFL